MSYSVRCGNRAPGAALTEALRRRVLELLCEEAGFDPQLAKRLHL